jgi:hypothetical protein
MGGGKPETKRFNVGKTKVLRKQGEPVAHRVELKTSLSVQRSNYKVYTFESHALL